jgi:hypothetical protein
MGNLLKDVGPELLMVEKSTMSDKVDNITGLGEDPITTIGTELEFLHLSEQDEQRSDARDCGIQRHLSYGNNAQWTSPESNDLVLLWRFEVDAAHRWKFDTRWEGPYRLGDVSFHNRTGGLFDIQTGDSVKIRQGGLKERCRFNDLAMCSGISSHVERASLFQVPMEIYEDDGTFGQRHRMCV